MNTELVSLNNPSFTQNTATDVSSSPQLTACSKTITADPGIISKCSSDYKAHYEVEKIRPETGHVRLSSPFNVGDARDTRQDGQRPQEIDGERTFTAQTEVLDTGTVGLLSRATPHDVQRAHASGGSFLPVCIVGTTHVDALLSRAPDFGTADPPPQSEKSQLTNGDSRQFTDSRPLALEESQSLLMKKLTIAHQSLPNPSQTSVLPLLVVTSPAQPSHSSVSRTFDDPAT